MAFTNNRSLLSFSSAGNSGVSLPEPEPSAYAHSERLIGLIRREIDAHQGSLPFIRFMELALYAPGLGYYSNAAPKLGPAGDFVTAPEVSSLFSRCLARQCAEILQISGGSILELGAGSGIMAADILQELAALDCLPERYLILEVSAELRQRQQTILRQRAGRWPDKVQIEWLSTLPPPGFCGIVLGNEVLDAMPVQRFRVTAQGIRLLHIGWNGHAFDWCEGDTPAASVPQQLTRLAADAGLPEGYESEYNPYLSGWFAALGDILEQGVILLIDYGYPRREYYHPQRCQGTLICHYRHRAHDDPLILPGLQDISASVDFSAVTDAATAAGLTLAGYTSQNYFLFGCGLQDLLAAVEPDSRHYLELARQVKLLTLPAEMGERFKAIAFARPMSGRLCGFTFFDERGRL